jgi:hypothetical protein
MTEAEWLASTKVRTPVMNWLRRRGSDRRFYLAAAAFVRQVEPLLCGQRYRDLLPLVEQFADGLAESDALLGALRGLDHELDQRRAAWQAAGRSPTQASKQLAADSAARWAAVPFGGWFAAINSLHEALRAGKRKEMEAQQIIVLRDIFGNPFRPVPLAPAWLTWRDGTIPRLAEAVYEDRELSSGHLDNSRLAVLADALEDAGCDNSDILAHCRGEGPHVRGCWVVDLLLGKE